MSDTLHAGPHKGRVPAEIDVCERCMGYLAYATLGDWSRHPSSRTPDQVKADNSHARLMVRNLGVSLDHVVNGGSSSNEDGSFSHGGCEACGARSCTVYPATMYYRPK